MIYEYTCIDCVERAAGKKVSELSVADHNILSNRYKILVKHRLSESPTVVCPICDGNNTCKLLQMETSYVRGYGYLDKKGVYNDMDLHKMASGNDPYAGSRAEGEAKDVIDKLRKNKKRNVRSKNVYM